MRVRIDFTIEFSDDSLREMLDFAGADNVAGLRDFLKGDAEQYIVDYIDSNVASHPKVIASR